LIEHDSNIWAITDTNKPQKAGLWMNHRLWTTSPPDTENVGGTCYSANQE
jgi:hypothetical protein